MSAPVPSVPSKLPEDDKDRFYDWLYQQGVSTVLLFLIVLGLWVGVPWARKCMKEDLDAINASHKESLNQMIDAHKESTNQVIESYDRHIDKVIESFNLDQTRDQKVQEHNQQLIEALLPDSQKKSQTKLELLP